jgi:hypothetical protein
MSPELVDNTYNHTGIAEKGQSSAVKHKSTVQVSKGTKVQVLTFFPI